jgi:N-acetylmuramoyl-L-alanine amidase
MVERLNRLFEVLKGRAGIALAVAFAAVCALAVSFGEGRASGGGVSRVRLGGDAFQTRVVVELDRSVKGRLIDPERLDRVVLALPGVSVDGDLQGRGQGLVRDWTVDRAGGSARVKLNLSRQAAVKRRFLLPPGDGVKVYRYVVDLEAGAPAATTRSAPQPASPGLRPPTRVMPAALMTVAPVRKGKRVIVIDPGHGGKDPGAAGVHVREKVITLAAARALADRLEKTGRYKVVMTRSDDLYIPLESRVSLARAAGADLFISLHADAGPAPGLRGASVYTLSERGQDRAARRVMQRDDWFRDVALPGRDPAVNRILLDLTQRATKNRSAGFAKVLLDKLSDRTPLLQRSHRDAGFVVLLAPDVPAVLLEMGFITNAQDEAVLTDPVKRGRLMTAVALAVDEYFEGERRSPMMAALP